MVKFVKLLVVFVFVISFQLTAQDYRVKAYTDTSEYMVGDYITYTVEMPKYDGVSVKIGDFADTLKTVNVIKKDEPVEVNRGNESLILHNFTLSVYDSTEVEIPPVPVAFTNSEGKVDTAYTDYVVFLVTTLKIDPQKDIRDVKGPLKIAFNYLWVALVVFLVLLIGLIIFFVVKRLRKKDVTMQSFKVVIPPHRVALSALSELEEKKLWQQGKIKEFHTEITYIIRSYFEERFKFNAVEMTSGEIVNELKNIKELSTVFDNCRNFFENADMVKFAKFEPMASVNEEMMKQAYDIVTLSKPDEDNTEQAGKVKEDKDV